MRCAGAVAWPTGVTPEVRGRARTDRSVRPKRRASVNRRVACVAPAPTPPCGPPHRTRAAQGEPGCPTIRTTGMAGTTRTTRTTGTDRAIRTRRRAAGRRGTRGTRRIRRVRRTRSIRRSTAPGPGGGAAADAARAPQRSARPAQRLPPAAAYRHLRRARLLHAVPGPVRLRAGLHDRHRHRRHPRRPAARPRPTARHLAGHRPVRAHRAPIRRPAGRPHPQGGRAGRQAGGTAR